METCVGAPGDAEASLVAAERALHLDGDLRTGRCRFDLAFQVAERAGDGPATARAALGLGGMWVHEHRTAASAAKVLSRQRQALANLDPRSPLAVRLRARLVAEEDHLAGRHETILRALPEARDTGDPVAVAETLSLAHQCLMSPGHEALRLELAHELICQAARTGRRGDLLAGLLWRTVDLFLAADPRAERSLAELRGLLAVRDHLAVGFVVQAVEVMLAIRAGRFAQAEALAAVCAERGEAAGDADAANWFGAQLATVRWYQGRIAEFVPALSGLVNSPALGSTDFGCFPALAVAAAAAGDQRVARGMLARVGDPATLSRTRGWLATVHAVVEAAFLLDDAETAARAYELLVPFAHLPVVVGPGVACFGSVQHALGTAALTAGEPDRAVEHLGAAVQANLALGHWPATCLSRHRLGQALALRHGPDDVTARRQLALAGEEAAGLGMTLPAASTRNRLAPGGGPAAVSCRRSGRHWRLDWRGRSALVDDSVGMRHLAVLTENPGREILAADLAAGPGGGLPDQAGSNQPMLDEQARLTYKHRLSQLQAEIDQYRALNDPERAAAAVAERDWLLAELTAAAGLGGRVRAFADGRERARIAVGKAIRRALARIADADPVIADELRATVHTGLRCRYLPR
ncbi:hypothetical protein HII36_00120 [Nonomuraea sp. NN258]|nr:hypothetical protein [Nonomuraea antri]